MSTHKTHIEPQKCFINAVFCNGDKIHTSINPAMTDDQIFNYYIGREFTFSKLDENDNEIEIKSKMKRLLITRESDNIDIACLPTAYKRIAVCDFVA